MRMMDYSLILRTDWNQLLLLLFVFQLLCSGESHCLYNTPPAGRIEFGGLMVWSSGNTADDRFGWSGAYPEVHWFVPIFFTGFFGVYPSHLYLLNKNQGSYWRAGIGAFILFQTIFAYLSDSYPEELASVFTLNDLFRSSFGAYVPISLFVVDTDEN